ncbi:LIM/homeobox protein Lhx2-like isoform X2 [Anthonomus grandis grandis]|nr:LIM/homeobox protein Lhx2-like isoform X2 [Anthonomus grandis grandis]XP_050312123.1 LIM/homeobox protein Lhx2-like isoform X2 [Anthonomus grandis grandis]XP_050312124.1 LIM/homeobox protein Lhx2-like isoform X2 [Anthonomus grandis grandis]
MLKERETIDRGGCASPCSSMGGNSSEGGGGAAASSCAGCGGRIHDRFYLLAVDRQWHACCLKCCECKLPLDTELTCFAREGNIYCKDDYYRMFAVTRCGRCHAGISANELVMRARELVYHLHCFSCTLCGIPLSKGDHFGIRDGLIYCRPHYEMMDTFDPHEGPGVFSGGESPGYYPNTPPQNQKGRPRKRKPQHPQEQDAVTGCGDLPVGMRMAAATLEMLHQGDLSSSMESLSYDSSVTSPGSSNGQQNQRTKRMRTSFKHHQLRTMKTYFAINQNPDAKDLKQLAQKTGLSKRVLQVWFQNARAKWRRNLMRQEGTQGAQSQSGAVTGASPTGSSIMEASMSHQGGLDDLHHHLHSQNSQTLAFSDIY